jgi:CRP-like cAMP-binding protein
MTLPKHKIDFRILDKPEIPIREVAPGEIIISEGSVAHEMFLVRKGRAEIRVKDQPVEEVGTGGIFGEMALIDQSTRSATVVALEDTEIIPINERLFVNLVQDAPNFAMDVMRTPVQRLKTTNKRI